jgi:hypothetical protein
MGEETLPKPDGESESESTDLPLLHTWPSAYGFVLASFVLWVALLYALTRFFSS